MKWFKQSDQGDENRISSLRIRDGDIILFRDESEPFKNLTDEEMRKIKLKENSQQRSIYTKERTLHIEQREIDVDLI